MERRLVYISTFKLLGVGMSYLIEIFSEPVLESLTYVTNNSIVGEVEYVITPSLVLVITRIQKGKEVPRLVTQRLSLGAY